MQFWDELTDLMVQTDRGVDFVTIDGGEGGTGAAPLIFTDSVSLPFQLGLQPRVQDLRRERGLHEQVVFIGAGKLGLPDNAIVAFALGCDMVNVAREAMLAIGCIQAQKCHTDTCPTGVATQNAWLAHGLDPATEIGSARQLHQDSPPRPRQSRRVLRGGTPRAHRRRRGRNPRRPHRLHTRCATSTTTTGLGTTLRHRPRSHHQTHDSHRATRLQRTTIPHRSRLEIRNRARRKQPTVPGKFPTASQARQLANANQRSAPSRWPARPSSSQ